MHFYFIQFKIYHSFIFRQCAFASCVNYIFVVRISYFTNFMHVNYFTVNALDWCGQIHWLVNLYLT
jgi:hypothetical protein